MFKQIHKVHKAGRSIVDIVLIRLCDEKCSRMESMFVCVCVRACLFACQFLLHPKCQNRSKPELIRWEHEMVERRKNWVKPLIDSELSWEICSHFVGSAESHRRHKACLFRTAQASSSPVTYSNTCPGDGTGLDETFFNARSKKAPLRKGKWSVLIISCNVLLIWDFSQISLQVLPHMFGWTVSHMVQVQSGIWRKSELRSIT